MPDPKSQSNPAGTDAEKNKSSDTAPNLKEGKGSEGDAGAEKKTSEQGGDEETMQISKKEYNALNAVKRKYDKSKDKSSKNNISSSQTGGQKFTYEKPEEPTTEEVEAADEKELNKLNKMIYRSLIDNDDYRSIVNSDDTLKRIINNNPLALIDGVPNDAEDAYEQISEILDNKVEKINQSKKDQEDKKKKKEEEDKKKSEPKAPEVKETKKEEKEQPKTLKDVEKGILSKVKVGE